ncbi:MAG TPA: hypothetical protein VGR89_00640 [Puia sp.]|nr:hypothetical protein [Puia sp.]
MRKIFISISSVIVLGASLAAGQSFINLDFEGAADLPPYSGLGATTNLLPGWSAFVGAMPASNVLYNAFNASPAVELLGSNALVPDGNFCVSLAGGGSVSQTGTIPTDAESLLFDALPNNSSQPFFVSLDGQDLSYFALSNSISSYGHAYTIYGANISAFAGDEETLAFSVHIGGGSLDDIQFSTMIVPEPPAISLILLSSGILIYARYRFQKKPYSRSGSG